MDLVATNLTYRPEEEFHLTDVSFQMEKGRLYTVLGRTLAGKTTMLRTIAGLQTSDSGSLEFRGKDFLRLPVWKRNIAMVYQQFINYPHLTVYENVAFPLKQRRMAAAEISQKVAAALRMVGLQGFETRKIQELSGGQQQRVAMARSFAKEADILLLDEPLVNLDYKLREQLRDEFRNIFSSGVSRESILVYSSTDPLEAMQLGGDIIVMDKACILQQAPAGEVFENPANTRVAEIANDPAMNLMAGRIDDERIVVNHDIKLDLPRHFARLSAGEYLFGIRASKIMVADHGIPFRVELAEISGSETFVHLRNGDQVLVGQLDVVQEFGMDEAVSVHIDTDWLYAFGTGGDLVSSPFWGGQ